jgi:hypothetical protein
MLTVRTRHSSSRGGHSRWGCDCDCGNEIVVLSTHLIQGKIKSCGCSRPVGKSHKLWTGFGEISGSFWKTIVRSSNGSKGRRPINLDVTIEDVWALFQKQNGKCSLTGLGLKFPVRATDNSWTASLDRIDSSKGYELGNIQWVHKDVNMMKRTLTQERFIQLCSLVARTSGGSCEVVDLVTE